MPSLVEKSKTEYQEYKPSYKLKYGPQSSSTPFKEKYINFENLDATDISEVPYKTTKKSGVSKTFEDLDNESDNSKCHETKNYNKTSEKKSSKKENGNDLKMIHSSKDNSALKRYSSLPIEISSSPVKRFRTGSTSNSPTHSPKNSPTKSAYNVNIDSPTITVVQKNLLTESSNSMECKRTRKISVNSNCSITSNSIKNEVSNNCPFNDKEVLTLLEDIDAFTNMEDCNILMDNTISVETLTGKSLKNSIHGNTSIQGDSFKDTSITCTPTTSMTSNRKPPIVIKQPKASKISKATSVIKENNASPIKKKKKKMKYSHKKTPTLSPGKINATSSSSKSSRDKKSKSTENLDIKEYLVSKKASPTKEQDNTSRSTENLQLSMSAEEHVEVPENIEASEKTPELPNQLNESSASHGKSSETENGSTKKKDMFAEASMIEECIKQIKKQEGFSKTIVEKLKKLKIKLKHEVPPQHTIENCCGTRSLSIEQRNRFEKYIKLKKGAFNTKEDEIIKTNWREFCKEHDWDTECVEPFLLMRHNNRYLISSLKERLKFVQFLGNNLFSRSLYSIYQRFKHIFNNKVKVSKKRYSAEEDSKILAYLQYGPNETAQAKFAALGKLLKKNRHSVWLRYHQHLKKQYDLDENDTDDEDVIRRVTWDIPLIEKFIKELLNVTLSDEVEELKEAKIPERVWKALQKKLKIHYQALRRFWYLRLHLQLFCQEPIFLNDVKIKLITYFYKKKISSVKDIKWRKVLRYFDGMTGVFLSHIFSRLLDNYKPIQNMLEVLDELYNDKITDLMNGKYDKELPRLSYIDGVVEVI